MSFTMQIETINYIHKVPQRLIFSPISLFYWHLQKCRSRRAPAFRSWRLGAQQPCVGTLPIVSFPLSRLILMSCFCNCPRENQAGSLASAAGMGMELLAGPCCSLRVKGLRWDRNPSIVSTSHGLCLPEFDHGMCRAGPVLGRGWCLEPSVQPGWDRVSVGGTGCDVVVSPRGGY